MAVPRDLSGKIREPYSTSPWFVRVGSDGSRIERSVPERIRFLVNVDTRGGSSAGAGPRKGHTNRETSLNLKWFK